MPNSPDLDQSLKSGAARGLFKGLCIVAVGGPVFTGAVFFGYMRWMGEVVQRSDVKQLALYSWLVTLAAMVFFALRHRRFGSENRRRQRSEVSYLYVRSTPGARAGAWEDRRSARMIRSLIVAAVGVAAVLSAILWFYTPARLHAVESGARMQIIGGIWLACMLFFAVLALRLRRTGLAPAPPAAEPPGGEAAE